MRNICTRLAIALALGAAGSVASIASAQALQLPTYSYFATDSSVLVPDRGTAVLGGMNSSSSGSNQFGPPFLPPSRSNGSSQGASLTTVTATIHDFEAMDETLLARAAMQRGAAGQRGAVAGKSGQAGAASAADGDEPAPVASVADLAARRAAATVRGAQEVAQLESKAREALSQGKTGVAKVYLQMAARRASGDRKAQLLATIQSLEPHAKPRARVAATR